MKTSAVRRRLRPLALLAALMLGALSFVLSPSPAFAESGVPYCKLGAVPGYTSGLLGAYYLEIHGSIVCFYPNGTPFPAPYIQIAAEIGGSDMSWNFCLNCPWETVDADSWPNEAFGGQCMPYLVQGYVEGAVMTNGNVIRGEACPP